MLCLCGGRRLVEALHLICSPHTGPASLVQSESPGGGSTYSFARRSNRVRVGLKLAGVHWCVKSLGHAAELTAGYYNTAHRNGYRCAALQVSVLFACYAVPVSIVKPPGSTPFVTRPNCILCCDGAVWPGDTIGRRLPFLDAFPCNVSFTVQEHHALFAPAQLCRRSHAHMHSGMQFPFA